MRGFQISWPCRALAACAAVGLCALPMTASAAGSIGAHFAGTAFPADILAATASAGAGSFAQINWNNVNVAATGLILNDNTGAATTAALTTTNASISSITGVAADPNEALNDGRANLITGTSWSFSVANIPYASYSIVVYDLQFSAGAGVGINVGATNYYTSSPLYSDPGYLDNNVSTAYIFTQGTSTNSGSPTPVSDYVVFSGLSGASQTVTLTSLGGGARSGGFQIVQAVPEPTSMAILTLGTAALLRKRRRKIS